MLVIATVWATDPGREALAAEDFAIDTDATCVTSSCHKDTTGKEFKHEPATDGELCSTCHEPVKEGQHGFVLAAKGSELCFTCHDEDAFAGTTIHGPVADGKCTRCHDPHTADVEKQLRADIPDLCFQCHKRRVKDHSGVMLPSPKRTFDNKKLTLHPPFEEGFCTSCHLPHAGTNHRLLVGAYPKGIYADFTDFKYVCFECHDEEVFTEARTLDLTGFRNGNLNLHFRHVNKRKGRSCKACHHHHGSANDVMIREDIPFGKRGINIRDFARTKTGGTCSPTCHRKVSYDRLEPVINDLRTTPRLGEDATPSELKEAASE